MTKLQVQKEKRIDDGVHNGTIKDIRFRTEPYNYTDIIIEMPDGFCITTSYPTMITRNSKLGLLLERFGAELKEGKELEIEPYFIEKKVTFMTISKKGKDGKSYSNVMPESVKPSITTERIT